VKDAADETKVDAERLHETVRAIFAALGLTAEDAGFVADALVEADLIGVSSHGVSNYIEAIYAPGLRDGTIAPRPEVEVLHETATTATLDGGGGMGHVVGRRAMALAMEKAAAHGLGLVVVRNSRHYGMAGHYALRALEAGMIGFSSTTADALVLPTGGREARFGTNPIAVAVPTGDRPPFLLDMATSTVPLGKVMLAARAGSGLPLGWAGDAGGRATTDAEVAAEAHRLFPLGGSGETLGGHKGYGLAVALDILCALLAGGASGQLGGLGGPVGHAFGAVRVDAFRPLEAFQADLDAYLDYLQATPALDPATPVIYPGVKEARSRAERERDGIPLHPKVVRYLRSLAAELGLEPQV
jgi:LDH2 family malate/lactate/ureidoglycolate dehydrogenase